MEFRELLELYKNGKYQEVIDNAKKINDYNAVFLLLRSYIALDMFKEALENYYKYRELLENNNLIESMKIYLFLLVKMDVGRVKIDQEIDYFKDKNYVNQETEEFLCKLDLYVENIRRIESVHDKYSTEEVIEMLKSDDENVVFSGLGELLSDEKYNLINFFPIIEKILQEKCNFNFIYGLLLSFLISKNYKCKLLFKKNGAYYNFDPSEFTKRSIEQDKLIQQAVSHIQCNEKNITIGDFVIRTIIRSSYLLVPNFITTLREIASYVCASYVLASEAFKVSLEGDTVYDFYLNIADKKSIDGYRDFLKKVFQ